MIHKGDLVELLILNEVSNSDVPKRAVAICDPYVTTFTERDHRGKPMYTSEKIVVDILVGSMLMTKYPVSHLQRCK